MAAAVPPPPRRLPFAADEELEQLHAAAYSRRTDDDRAVVDRVDVWLNRGHCPTAVEATTTLIAARLADSEQQQQQHQHYLHHRHARPCHHFVRSAYALALVRFVNTVVDSHQSGMYARSIASIAADVGLPLWLVELRHAATHEELPPLQVLRTAADVALAWINERFWMPTLAMLHSRRAPPGDYVGQLPGEAPAISNSHIAPNLAEAAVATTTAVPTVDASSRRANILDELRAELRAGLSRYRTVQKHLRRDESLGPQLAGRARRRLDELETSLRRAEAALRVGGTDDDDEVRPPPGGALQGSRLGDPSKLGDLFFSARVSREERRNDQPEGAGSRSSRAEGHHPGAAPLQDGAVLGALLDELLRPGMLVPLAKSKRPTMVSSEASHAGLIFSPLAESTLASWTPLLERLCRVFRRGDDDGGRGSWFRESLVSAMVDVLCTRRPLGSTSAAAGDLSRAASESSGSGSERPWQSHTSYRSALGSWVCALLEQETVEARHRKGRRGIYSRDAHSDGTEGSSRQGDGEQPPLAARVTQTCLRRPTESAQILLTTLQDRKLLSPRDAPLDSRVVAVDDEDDRESTSAPPLAALLALMRKRRWGDDVLATLDGGAGSDEESGDEESGPGAAWQAEIVPSVPFGTDGAEPGGGSSREEEEEGSDQEARRAEARMRAQLAELRRLRRGDGVSRDAPSAAAVVAASRSAPPESSALAKKRRRLAEGDDGGDQGGRSVPAKAPTDSSVAPGDGAPRTDVVAAPLRAGWALATASDWRPTPIGCRPSFASSSSSSDQPPDAARFVPRLRHDFSPEMLARLPNVVGPGNG